MTSKARVLLSWSSGKDSAWALHVLRKSLAVEVVGLLTTLNGAFDRVAMHAVRRELLEEQAKLTGLPLIQVSLPWPCTNEDYELAMKRAVDSAVFDLGVTALAFGDLFLEDVRAYREKQFVSSGFELLFPLWGLPTDGLAAEMVAAGLKAVLTSVDPRQLPASFAGRTFDAELLSDLPPGCDPCGEQGEFHTFAFVGPMFKGELDIRVGEIVERDGFVFADVIRRDKSIFDENGALTKEFLLERGTCCGNRCRNCPYEWEAVKEN